MENKEWFSDWFDSKYYHILYGNRDYEEAERFMRNLMGYLRTPENELIVDLACGKGRHSIYLNKLGYKVLGLDLSKQSVEQASKHENNRLSFAVHDMRQKMPVKNVGVVLNLFTSFGYFDQPQEDIKVLSSAYKALKKRGVLVIDFLNAEKVQNELIPYENKKISGINFEISKTIENNHVVKTIRFSDNSKEYQYEERVKLLRKENFEHYLNQVGFEIKQLFGDYNLNAFNSSVSPRLIIEAKKK